jgi:predicted DNA-binding transcriptional regulator YafY
MRGDQLARQWRVIRAIEASSNGLTVAEIAEREETGIRTIYRDLEALRPKCHAKPQSAPREIFRPVLPFLSTFLTLSHSIGKTIKRFSIILALRSLRLGVRRLDDFMRDSFKVMHDELYSVKVRISPAWARWVGEKIWHESQKTTKLPGGGLEMTFQVAGLDEIKRWVLSFGPECHVLEPEKFKKLVQQELQKNLAQYLKHRLSIDLMKEMRAV